MPSPPRVPSCCRYSATDRAFCKVDGRFVYLGPYGSPASHAQYARVVEVILIANPTATSSGPTVRVLMGKYVEFANSYYIKNGEPTNEAAMVTTACKRTVEAFGDLPAVEFGPLCLKAVSDLLVARGLSRTYVNASVTCPLNNMCRDTDERHSSPG